MLRGCAQQHPRARFLARAPRLRGVRTNMRGVASQPDQLSGEIGCRSLTPADPVLVGDREHPDPGIPQQPNRAPCARVRHEVSGMAERPIPAQGAVAVDDGAWKRTDMPPCHRPGGNHTGRTIGKWARARPLARRMNTQAGPERGPGPCAVHRVVRRGPLRHAAAVRMFRRAGLAVCKRLPALSDAIPCQQPVRSDIGTAGSHHTTTHPRS